MKVLLSHLIVALVGSLAFAQVQSETDIPDRISNDGDYAKVVVQTLTPRQVKIQLIRETKTYGTCEEIKVRELPVEKIEGQSAYVLNFWTDVVIKNCDMRGSEGLKETKSQEFFLTSKDLSQFGYPSVTIYYPSGIKKVIIDGELNTRHF